MLKLLQACWKSLTAGMFLLGLFWLPADVAQYDQALGPWQRLWAMFDRETLLWIFALALFGWLVWTDVRPFVRQRLKPRFPPKHAEACKQLAEELAEIRMLAFTAPTWANRPGRSGDRGNYLIFRGHMERVGVLISQITYDRETAETASDFIQMCALALASVEEGKDGRKERAEIDTLAGPFFEALQHGRGVNRASLPLPQWTLRPAS